MRPITNHAVAWRLECGWRGSTLGPRNRRSSFNDKSISGRRARVRRSCLGNFLPVGMSVGRAMCYGSTSGRVESPRVLVRLVVWHAAVARQFGSRSPFSDFHASIRRNEEDFMTRTTFIGVL